MFTVMEVREVSMSAKTTLLELNSVLLALDTVPLSAQVSIRVDISMHSIGISIKYTVTCTSLYLHLGVHLMLVYSLIVRSMRGWS